MRAMSWICLLGLLLAGTMAMGQQNVIRCSSDNGQVQKCRVGANQGIQFLRQRSRAACVEGQSYGIRRESVWVSKGCRADFQVVQNVANGNDRDGDRSDNQRVYNSDGSYSQNPDRDNDRDRRDHERDANNGTYNNGTYNNGTYNGGPYNNGANSQGNNVAVYPGRDANSNSGVTPQYTGQFKDGVSSCSSNQRSAQTYCQTGGGFRRAELRQQNGQCTQGQTWGVSGQGLWVAGGCSGQFVIQR